MTWYPKSWAMVATTSQLSSCVRGSLPWQHLNFWTPPSLETQDVESTIVGHCISGLTGFMVGRRPPGKCSQKHMLRDSYTYSKSCLVMSVSMSFFHIVLFIFFCFYVLWDGDHKTVTIHNKIFCFCFCFRWVGQALNFPSPISSTSVPLLECCWGQLITMYRTKALCWSQGRTRQITTMRYTLPTFA